MSKLLLIINVTLSIYPSCNKGILPNLCGRCTKTAALRAYTPVANSNEARVEDYYRYADLLKGQEALAEEYRERPIACRGKRLRCGPMTVCFSKSDFGRILTALKRRSSIPQEMSLVPNQLLWMGKSGFYLWPISSL